MKKIEENKLGDYYSVRMRAAKDGPHEQGGKHISGGERLSTFNDLREAVNFLLEKGLIHSKGKPDFMQIQFEYINDPITWKPPLMVTTKNVEDAEEGQCYAKMLLEKSGIPQQIIDKAYSYLAEYSGLAGALLVDIHSGDLINGKKKGIRVSRMDWLDSNYKRWSAHFHMPKNNRVKEALALATKVTSHPLTVAELCWSDDPDYITGYVASRKLGYQRVTKMKKYGDERGCRVFFVNGTENITSYIHYLEKQPVFVHWEE